MSIGRSHVITVLAATPLVVALGVGLIAGAEAQKSVNDGVYTAAQAARGERAFNAQCTTCHDAARFNGRDFIDAWAGKPLHALFDIMVATMPEDNPGALQDQQYADIVAFFLRLNEFPAGQEELEGSDEAMLAVQMEALKR